MFYRHKQWENRGQVSPHCPFYPQNTSREKTQHAVSGHWWHWSKCVPLRYTIPPCYSVYYLTLVSSSIAFRIFYPKSQQSALKAASLYPKTIISYSSKLQQLCIQWRRQKSKRSQIIWIYLTAKWTTSSRGLNNLLCWENYRHRKAELKVPLFYWFLLIQLSFLITYKRCLASVMLHHQYLHQFRDVYFKMHFCIPNMTLFIMWNEPS